MYISRNAAGIIAFISLILSPLMVLAHGSQGDDEVVPQSEYATAEELGLEGPGKTKGVASAIACISKLQRTAISPNMIRTTISGRYRSHLPRAVDFFSAIAMAVWNLRSGKSVMTVY